MAEFLCYTQRMDSDRHIWQVWARNLHRWGISSWISTFLESAGPLTLFAAQVVYIGQPLVNWAFPGNHLEALAQMFEDTSKTRAFVDYLRETSHLDSI